MGNTPVPTPKNRGKTLCLTAARPLHQCSHNLSSTYLRYVNLIWCQKRAYKKLRSGPGARLLSSRIISGCLPTFDFWIWYSPMSRNAMQMESFADRAHQRVVQKPVVSHQGVPVMPPPDVTHSMASAWARTS